MPRCAGNPRAAVIALCGTIVAAFARPATAATPLAVEDVLQAPTLAAYSPPSFSPDNRLLAYVVTDNARRLAAVDDDELLRTGVAWYGVAADIWVTDLEAGTHRNVTGARGHNWTPSWSPDGERLAFLADRSAGSQPGPARLWVWERSTGELRAASNADVREGFAQLQWAGDEHSVLASLFAESLGRDEYVSLIRGRARDQTASADAAGKSTPEIFEFDPALPNAMPSADQINLDLWLRDLGLIDVRTGEVRRLTRDVRIGHYAVSPDRRQLAYSVLNGAEKPGSGQYLYDIVLQDLATERVRVVAPKVRLTLVGSPFSWSPESDRLAWRTAGPLAEDEIHVVAARGGPVRRIARNARIDDMTSLVEENPPVWDARGKHVFFIREGTLWRAAADGSQAAAFAKSDGHELEIIAPRQQRLFAPGRADSAIMLSANPSTKHVGLVKIDLKSGAVSHVLQEAKRYGGYGTEPTISADGTRLAYVAEDPHDSPNLFLLGGDFTRPRKVSEVAPALAKRTLGKAQVIEWRSIDGETQRGALVFPADHQDGKSYPLIVKVYGGSSISNDLNRFGYASGAVENLQIYATRGYALLLADSKLNVGTPMVDLMKSVMPGIDKAIETGIADPARIGITGHSYGGYSTLSLIAQSPRFKAAVMRAGTGNLMSGYGHLAPDGTNYGLAWSESGQGRMGGTPWEFRERYLENSPIFYLDRVETPLLIIHGDKDDAVPVFLADEVFTGLRRLGKAVTYVRYPGESHWEGAWNHANQIDALNRQIAWFDRHLKGAAPPAWHQGAPAKRP